MFFSVEIRDARELEEGGAQVEIYIDKEALEELNRELGWLEKPGDHCHFWTPSWGGYDLSETPYVEGNTIVNHLKITLV